MFLECYFWSQDEDENFIPTSELAHNQAPTGMFFAKELNAYTEENQLIGNTFLLESNNVQIATYDDVKEIKRNDLVEYNDKVWRVDSIQRIPIKKQRQFMNDGSNITYLSLRG
jgi:hypothetical protein